MGGRMIGIRKSLRHLRYDIEDFIDDLLPRPSLAPRIDPPPPRRKPEPSPVQWAYGSISFNRATDADIAALDAEWTQGIMRRIGSNTFFEIEYL
jgi:hypothetical protein